MDQTPSDERSGDDTEHGGFPEEIEANPETVAETSNERIVQIACEGSHVMDVADMREFQGNLKRLDESEYLKLRGQIVDNGYSSPIAVWQSENSYYILDGHQRKRVLSKLREDGWVVPPLPVVMVAAKSYKQAKQKLLAATSQYEKMETQGLYEYLMDSSITLDELYETTRFSEVNFDRFREEFFDAPPPPDVGGEGGVGIGGGVSGTAEWLVVVTCDNEQQQAAIFEELQGRGLQCKIM